MESPVILVLIGSLISLISALAGIIVQHKLAMQKLAAESRQHPFRVVYDKQTEFFDALSPVLLGMNAYITTIDVWLGETSSEAQAKARKAMENNSCVTRFDELLQRYYMYLPEQLLKEANRLHAQCMLLSNSADMNRTYDCINLLFKFQNSIRETVGIDRLSEDFFKAFVPKR